MGKPPAEPPRAACGEAVLKSFATPALSHDGASRPVLRSTYLSVGESGFGYRGGRGVGGFGVPLQLQHAPARVERGGDVAAEEDGGHAARAEPPRERQRGEEEREQVAAPRGKATRERRARARASRPRPGQLERWCAGARSIAKSRQRHAAHGQAREYEILVCLMRCVHCTVGGGGAALWHADICRDGWRRGG